MLFKHINFFQDIRLWHIILQQSFIHPSIHHPCTHPDGPSRPVTTLSIFSFCSVRCQMDYSKTRTLAPVNDVVDPPPARSCSCSISVHHAQRHCLHQSIIIHSAYVFEQLQLPPGDNADYRAVSLQPNTDVGHPVYISSWFSVFACNISFQRHQSAFVSRFKGPWLTNVDFSPLRW